MTRPSIAMILFGVMLSPACGDDASSEGTASSTGSTGSDPTTTMMPSETTTEPGTSSGPGPMTGSGSTGPGMVDSSSGTDTDTDTDTAGVDCDQIPPGPLAFDVVFEPGVVFDGSEDIAFDGQGNIVGKSGGQIVAVDAMGAEADSWPDGGNTFGLRYRSNGDLLAAKVGNNQIRIVQSGDTLVGEIGSVNGLYPDFDGNIWFTNFSAVQRVNPDDSVDSIVTGGDGNTANGVVFDPDRGLLYYTNYGPGLIRSVEIDGDGNPGTISMVASIPGASLDGLSMDACGNLYVVDQGNDALYRVFLDPTGAPVGDPESLVDPFPANVANAIFGVGEGWDEMSLYAAGVPGGVYRVEIGVPGAPTPTP
ncbi:MAG: SMP-30/gluconolactonase/LRE family protein [Myxococcota bacterium]